MENATESGNLFGRVHASTAPLRVFPYSPLSSPAVSKKTVVLIWERWIRQWPVFRFLSLACPAATARHYQYNKEIIRVSARLSLSVACLGYPFETSDPETTHPTMNDPRHLAQTTPSKCCVPYFHISRAHTQKETKGSKDRASAASLLTSHPVPKFNFSNQKRRVPQSCPHHSNLRGTSQPRIRTSRARLIITAWAFQSKFS
jgi:hypothetical protein